MGLAAIRFLLRWRGGRLDAAYHVRARAGRKMAAMIAILIAAVLLAWLDL
jgi:hypothetical protein